ncbi:MAG: rod shape-determining protein [Clostridia bacterium]|nr:rod shape-determining protein [Clostridia bacterium]
MAKDLGIDLGSSNIVVSAADEGILLREPAIAAVDRADGTLHKIGSQAESVETSKAGEYSLARLFGGGLLEAPEVTEQVLRWCYQSSSRNGVFDFRALLAIPTDLSEGGERTLLEISERAGAAQTYLVYAPIAALVGAGYAPTTGAIVVDFGTSTTDIAILGGGKLILRHTFRHAGQSIDEAIADYLLSKHGIKIGLRTAEKIKFKIATVEDRREQKFLDIRGQHLATGTVRTVRISSLEMLTILEEPLSAFFSGLCQIISRIPSEFVNEIFKTGILLSGGSSMIDGLARAVTYVTGIRATVVQNPIGGVAIGLSKMLKQLPASIRVGHENITSLCLSAYSEK